MVSFWKLTPQGCTQKNIGAYRDHGPENSDPIVQEVLNDDEEECENEKTVVGRVVVDEVEEPVATVSEDRNAEKEANQTGSSKDSESSPTIAATGKFVQKSSDEDVDHGKL